MTMQKVFFRVMLGSLGVAAICGVLAMLTANYEILGRVAGTAIMTAVTAAVMNRLGSRPASGHHEVIVYIAMAVTGLCYLLTMVAIWTPGESWRWWLTALAIASTTPMVLGAWQLGQWAPAQLAGRVGFGLACVLFVGWLVVIWRPDSSIIRWMSVVATIGIFGSLGLVCLIQAKFEKQDIPRWIGVGCATLGAIWSLLLIYLDIGRSEFTARLLWSLTSVPVFIAHVNLCDLVPLRSKQKWVRFATLGGSLVALVGFDWLVLMNVQGAGFIGRLTGAATIVSGCGSLALILLAIYNRLGHGESPFAKTKVIPSKKFKCITVFCPRCQTQQEISLISATCSRCGLQICVRLQEAIPVRTGT